MTADEAGSLWHQPGDVRLRKDALVREFRAVHGCEPAGVWAAPGRVNLLGEHVDYAAGLCLPMALPHSTLVAAAAVSGGRLVARSRQRPAEVVDIALEDVGPGRPAGWGGYVAGVTALLTRHGSGDVGLQLLVDSTVPVGAGLSSSAALSCATALAVDELHGGSLRESDSGRAELAGACVRAENDVVLAPTGGMDQAASLRARAGHVLLLDCQDMSVEQLPFEPEREGLTLLVVDTRTTHDLAEGQYSGRRASVDAAAVRLGVPQLRDVAGCESAAAELAVGPEFRPVVRHVLSEIARVEAAAALLRAGDLAGVGPLLNASHASLRHDFGVSCAELDLAVEATTEAGALGARMTGGGFGGSAIALVPSPLLPAVVNRVCDAFAKSALRAPAFLLAPPSAGGHRVL